MKLNRIASLFVSIALLASVVVGYSTTASAAPKTDPTLFWTAERINKATAFDMVFEKGSKVAKRVPSIKSTARAGGGTTSSTGSVLGASWTNLGLPLTATGKVFFKVGTSYFQCSGALVKDGSATRSIVLTAGHCLFDNETSSFVENWIFIPSYDINQVSINGCTSNNGCWAAESIHAHPNFTSQLVFDTQATLYDWGFANIIQIKAGLLPDGGDLSKDGDKSFEISFGELPLATKISSFGYPASGKYKGNDLVYSSGALSFDTGAANKTYSLPSNMTGGCSGGPWISALSTTFPFRGILSSVNSYKYGTSAYIYGPKFSSETRGTYEEALNFVKTLG